MNLLDAVVGLGLGALIDMVLLVKMGAVVVSDAVGPVSFLDQFERTVLEMCARGKQA